MDCPKCGYVMSDLEAECPRCKRMGAAAAGTAKARETNTSGTSGTIPAEVAGNWSWGAFALTWIWAIGNKAWLGLLAAVPTAAVVFALISSSRQGAWVVVGALLMAVIVTLWLGSQGHRLAWRSRRFSSVSQFHETMGKWDKAGRWVFLLKCCFAIFIGVMAWSAAQKIGMKFSDIPRLFIHRSAVPREFTDVPKPPPVPKELLQHRPLPSQSRSSGRSRGANPSQPPPGFGPPPIPTGPPPMHGPDRTMPPIGPDHGPLPGVPPRPQK